LRQKEGISIKKLAPKLNLNYTYISKLENSKVLPSTEVITKFANYFKQDVDELMISAGKLPPDIEMILKKRPKETLSYLRDNFAQTDI